MCSVKISFSLFHYLWFFKHLFLLQVIISSLPPSIYFMTHFSIFNSPRCFCFPFKGTLFLHHVNSPRLPSSITWSPGEQHSFLLVYPQHTEIVHNNSPQPSFLRVSLLLLKNSYLLPIDEELYSFAWFFQYLLSPLLTTCISRNVCFPRLQNSSLPPASVLQLQLDSNTIYLEMKSDPTGQK